MRGTASVRRRVGWMAVAAVLLVAACSSPALPSGPTGAANGTPTVAATPGSARPCAGTVAPARWTHVVWIWFENKAPADVIGSSSAPYLTGLSQQCASATDYHGIAHPSEPNYIAATSGSTHGITDDGGPAVHPLSGGSLFSQVTAAGGQWRSYNESMPSPCSVANARLYAPAVNPAAFYTALRTLCPRWDVGLDQLNPDSLPAFTFITPNFCHDMHDCSVTIGDRWLSGMLPELLDSPSYARGDTAIFITWDEDDGSKVNKVPLLVIAPSVTPGTTIGHRLDHYSLLRTTEQMLGLPFLGAAASAPSIPGL